MFNKIRMTWISWVQLGAILCSLPITIILAMDGVSTWIATYKFTRAIEMFGAGNNGPAMDQAEASIGAIDSFTSPLELKAYILLDKGETAQAQHTYNEILQLQPDHAPAKLGLAACIMRENEKKFADWAALSKDPAKAGEAAELRSQLDKAIEQARSQIKQALDMHKASGGGRYADGQVYLGLLHLLEDPAKSPEYLHSARRELEKALPATNPQSSEIPSLDAAMKLYNGLGYVSYMESLELWKKVDELVATHPLKRVKLRPPATLDREVLTAANLAADKSYEAAGYFLSATHYGRIWRDPYQNFEMAMTAYLVREELAATVTKKIGDFLALGKTYADHKESTWAFYRNLNDEKWVQQSFKITDEDKHVFDQYSYRFNLAMCIGYLIAGDSGNATLFQTRAEHAYNVMPPKHRDARLLTTTLYLYANQVDLTPNLPPQVVNQLFMRMEQSIAGAVGQFGPAHGFADSDRAWAWATAAVTQYVYRKQQNSPMSYTGAMHLLDEHALGKYSPQGSPQYGWIADMLHVICDDAIKSLTDNPQGADVVKQAQELKKKWPKQEPPKQVPPKEEEQDD